MSEAAARIWPKVCHHLNGMALAPAVAAMARRGVLAVLDAASEPLAVGELAAGLGLRQGYLALCLRLLASQGFVAVEADRAALTPLGRQWRGAAIAYDLAPEALAAAGDLAGWLAAEGPEPAQAARWRRLLGPEAAGQGAALAEEGARHVHGAMVAALMRAFCLRGLWEPLVAAGRAGLALAELGLNAAALGAAFDLLARQGWAWIDGPRAGLSAEGALLADYAPQYFAPLSYLPTFRALDDFLTGAATPEDLTRDHAGAESHLDRRLDIEFSGLVFKKGCAEPFFAAVLPVFDQPLERQPACVVDTGCGDATLLVELHRAIARRTLRGRHLGQKPLIMVGAEFNPQARQTAAQRLEREGISHLAIDGDITDPEALARRLGGCGLDPFDALHLSKSVAHNRALTQAPDQWPAGQWPAQGLFVTRGGRIVAPKAMAHDLTEFFRRWLPHVRRHGMALIEAHTVEPAVAAPHRHRHLITCTEAYHILSGQYLVDAGSHRRAYQEAGFTAVSQADLGRAMVGQALMSVDFLRPAQA
ncbi:hypothetical protein Deba_2498 [Desulfarculus baarsii DSM 2075]|uniref:Methyltransferase type 12 n=1 Tax=Desulfarculus baarsii (strain ATCC 33931 / DSM 2075 / LMG 7858 / VKM B-1802 / 2st14) TaxID=644282 RepID=E1QJW5_DESB2|nr:hypothetical protein [Desulfarculus baarsii]ADK85858.1 hypothetical protein Deba_2498 [Desulfarculus baarsii DSM 2075]